MLLLTQVATSSSDPDLISLFERIAAGPSASLGFEEVRTSELLQQPVLISGTLSYADDGRLIRDIQQPRRETHILFQDHVEISRPGGYFRSFSLHKAPELQALRYALSAVLTGQAQQLQEHFDLIWWHDHEHWRLRLTPRDEAVAQALEALVMSGHNDQIDAIELQLRGAELIHMDLYAADQD